VIYRIVPLPVTSNELLPKSRHYLMLNISETAKDTAIVAMKCE